MQSWNISSFISNSTKALAQDMLWKKPKQIIFYHRSRSCFTDTSPTTNPFHAFKSSKIGYTLLQQDPQKQWSKSAILSYSFLINFSIHPLFRTYTRISVNILNIFCIHPYITREKRETLTEIYFFLAMFFDHYHRDDLLVFNRYLLDSREQH